MFRRSNSVVSASGGEAEKLLDMGSRVLEAAKRMCQSAFIEFDLGLMHTGLTLGLIHASLLLVLAAVLGTKAQVQSLFKRPFFPFYFSYLKIAELSGGHDLSTKVTQIGLASRDLMMKK